MSINCSSKSDRSLVPYLQLYLFGCRRFCQRWFTEVLRNPSIAKRIAGEVAVTGVWEYQISGTLDAPVGTGNATGTGNWFRL